MTTKNLISDYELFFDTCVVSSKEEVLMTRVYLFSLLRQVNGLAEIGVAALADNRILIDRVIKALRNNNLIVARCLQYDDPRTMLKNEGEFVLSEIRRSLGRFPEVPASTDAGQVAVLAYEALMGEVGVDALQDTVEKSNGAKMSGTTMVVACLVVALAVAIGVYLACHFWKVSSEFRLVARSCKGHAWADKLLRTGSRATWTVRGAWNLAGLADEERLAAIEALSATPAFQKLEFGAGIPLDPSTMAPDCDGAFVWDLIEPGLVCEDGVVARARVRVGSPEYVALRGCWNHELTARYRTAVEELRGVVAPPSELNPGALMGVLDSVVNDGKVSAWLAALVQSAPPNRLALVKPCAGEPFNEREMRTTAKLRLKSKAEVVELLHYGLRRQGTRDVLLKAKVLARDTVTHE